VSGMGLGCETDRILVRTIDLLADR